MDTQDAPNARELTAIEVEYVLAREYGFLDAKYGFEYMPPRPHLAVAYAAGRQEWGVEQFVEPEIPVHQQTWGFWNEKDHARFMNTK